MWMQGIPLKPIQNRESGSLSHFDSFEASPVSPHPLLGTSTWRLSLLIVAAANLTRRFLRRRAFFALGNISCRHSCIREITTQPGEIC
ncbi:hypothetical protein MUK42_36915 [Musa troglodytarum]|uniref:Uncharacterized protein n=1 Tax=Musa troglodytarum TaxID=320322 RepID=A0A9E7FP05_9LILI|nr:hypothetical protein MUK42_36908 [Musa troglodytarum]URD99784.1 hypothetical protein MUK42_36915 [Musa troglodytarum]